MHIYLYSSNIGRIKENHIDFFSSHIRAKIANRFRLIYKPNIVKLFVLFPINVWSNHKLGEAIKLNELWFKVIIIY